MANQELWADYIGAADRADYSAAAPAKRSAGSDLDKNAFLLLLLTQLQYQDPLNPMDNSAMVAQLAQFSALEQMQSLNQSFSRSQGFSMIGRSVYGTSYNEQSGMYDEFYGRVSSVAMRNGEVYLQIGDMQVRMDEVEDIYEDYYSQNMLKALSDNSFIDQSIALVGRTIQAVTMNGDMEASGFVEGMVDYVKFSGGSYVLVVGNKEVYPQEVISVSDGNLVIGKFVSAEADGERITGQISGITIIGEKAYVTIGGKNVEIEKIDKLIDALRYVGQTVKSGSIEGVVTGVLIKDAVPFLLVGDEEVPLSDIAK